MTETSVKPIPEGINTVSAHLVVDDGAAAIDFYKKAFGATEMMRLQMPDGKLMHGSVRIGNSVVMLVDEMPKWGALGPKARNGTSVTLHIYTENVDAFMERAAGAGAKVVMPAQDMFWGDRYGQVEDPFGHRWSVATHTRDVSHEDMQKAMANMKPGNCG